MGILFSKFILCLLICPDGDLVSNQINSREYCNLWFFTPIGIIVLDWWQMFHFVRQNGTKLKWLCLPFCDNSYLEVLEFVIPFFCHWELWVVHEKDHC